MLWRHLDDPDLCAAACRALADFASPEVEQAWPVLMKLANDANGANRTEAMLALGVLKVGPAIPDLIKALDDPDHGVQTGAARALEAMGPAAVPALPRLMVLLEDKDLARCDAAMAPLAVLATPLSRPYRCS